MTSASDLASAPTDGTSAGTDPEIPEAPESTVERTLGRLIERGFRFVHPRDEDGEIVTIVGVRAHGAVIDVVRLDAEDEVTATRMPIDEADILAPRTVLWRREGAMCAVVDELLGLPDVPAEIHAPRRAGGTRGCWVPGSRGRAKWLMATA